MGLNLPKPKTCRCFEAKCGIAYKQPLLKTIWVAPSSRVFQ